MRTVLLSLLAASLCLHAAHSLKCYTCVGQQSNSDCLTEAVCSSSDVYCLTAVVPPPGFNNTSGITKQCAPSCSTMDTEFNGAKASVSCCQADLCNHRGGTNGTMSGGTNGTMTEGTNEATNLHISSLALVISVGFLGTLL
ncbi:lymphocyte antigen 6E-like [Rhinatrema bivittatum]|uniref:lymphocyte antigen 6E-like n=1 Tax=Rhinatrema bivittatum TaxID=194408 RepID=UPI00112DDDCD|nr:lymphocyte antigen 6E-like [Rhinatrema bivittatum]